MRGRALAVDARVEQSVADHNNLTAAGGLIELVGENVSAGRSAAGGWMWLAGSLQSADGDSGTRPIFYVGKLTA